VPRNKSLFASFSSEKEESSLLEGRKEERPSFLKERSKELLLIGCAQA
jgi:hypothetical protein